MTVQRALTSAPAGSQPRQSRVLRTTLFVSYCFWPFGITSDFVDLAFLAFVTVTSIALSLRRLVLPNAAMLLFAGVVAVQIGISVREGVDVTYFLSHTNHLVQFTVYVFAALQLSLSCDWRHIWADWRFQGAALSVVVGTMLLRAAGITEPGGDTETLALFALLGAVFINARTKKKIKWFLVLAALSAVLASLSSRLSFSAMMLSVLVLYWVDLPEWLLRCLAMAIILVPPLVYLSLSPEALLWLYEIDANAGIRADFIRGAWFYLQQAPLFGIGFEGAYRPMNFSYGIQHPYLNSLWETQVISNHHSMFDVALRLGFPAAALLWWSVFMGPKIRRLERFHSVLYIAISVGVSINPWLEDQDQLPMIAFLVALVAADRVRSARYPDAPSRDVPNESR